MIGRTGDDKVVLYVLSIPEVTTAAPLVATVVYVETIMLVSYCE